MKENSWGEALQSRDEQHQIKRMAIMRVAARAFSTRGYSQTSLTQLATELSVTKPTLYYYVKNKDDILEGILQIAMAQLREMIKVASLSQRSGRETLHSFFHRYGEIVTDDFGACLIMMRINAPEEKFRRPYHDLSQEVFLAMRQTIRSGIDDGSITPCNPKYVASALLATLNEAVYWHLIEKKQSPKEAAGGYFDIFVKEPHSSQTRAE